jgi:hypothetical protein
VLVVGLYLEEGIALARRSDGLIDQRLERNEGSQDHLEERVVDAALPVVVILLHDRGGFGGSAQHELFNAL